MNLRINKIALSSFKRILMISDIHGALDTFKQVLDKVKFSERDALVIVGDLCEKGNQSAETLRYIRILTQTNNNVFVVCGNCDILYEEFEIEQTSEYVDYLKWRKQSLLNEWLSEVGFQIQETTTPKEIYRALQHNAFQDDINFLKQLPHIIESEAFIFAHAGITNEKDVTANHVESVVSMPLFYKQDVSFKKTVVVGHYPVSAYYQQTICMNPVYDAKKHILCLDGGNVVKGEIGQLNVCIYEQGKYHFDYVHKQQHIIAIKRNDSEKQTIVNIVWPDYSLRLLEKGEHFSLCESANNQAWIKNEHIDMDKLAANQDTTSYQFSYIKGDCFECISDAYSGYYLAKQNGIIGWVNKEHFRMENL